MSMNASKIVQSLSQDLLDMAFDIKRQSALVLHDAGIDAGGLTAEDIEKAYKGTLTDRWDDVAFTCDEVLAKYNVIDLSNEDFVRAIFVSLILGEAIQRGHGHWSWAFDKTCELIVRNRDKGDYEFRMSFLAELVCRRWDRKGDITAL